MQKLQNENYLQKRNNLSTRERLQGSYPRGMFNPLGTSDVFLFRNNFNNQNFLSKNAFYSNKEDFSTLKGIISL